MDGPKKLELLVGDFQVSKQHDVAVLKVTSEQKPLFEKYAPLRQNLIGTPEEIRAFKIASLVGYPETKNRKVYGKNEIKGLTYSLLCKIEQVDMERITVSFHRRKNLDAKSRKRVEAPDPHGMSGGAMFGGAVKGETIEGKSCPKLAGILTDQPRNKSSIVARHIAIAMAIIRDAYNITLPVGLNSTHIKTNSRI